MNKISQQQQIKVKGFFNRSCKCGLPNIWYKQSLLKLFDVRHLGRGALYNDIIYDTCRYDTKDLIKKPFINKDSYHIIIDDHL